MDFLRRAKERRISEEIAAEINRQLGPIPPETLAERNELICAIFGAALDRHKIVNEAIAARVMAFVPQFLADQHRKFAELDRKLGAAMRPRMIGTRK
jgi:hypothetical protein